MMARAEEFGNIHSGLSSLSADGWEGRAADHFRSKFEVQIQGWVDAQEAFSSASEAYSSYASTLASAQSQCDGIRVRWEQGRDAVQQAQYNQADARNQAAADGGSPVFDASCDEGPGRSAMAAAVADFQTLVDQVNEAGDLLITALNAGIAKLPERTWWDSVKRTVGSIVGGAFEAVVDLAKLLWKLGGGEAWVDFGRMLMGDMTWDEYFIKHYEIPAETLVGMAKALWNDPVGFMTAVGKSLLDWDTWTDDPARAIGHLLPDVIVAIATMGGSAGVSAGEKALTGGARALRIGKEVFKAILPISPDDIRSLAKLGKNMVGKLSTRGLNTAADVADLANTAKHLAGATDRAHDAAHAANGMAGALDGAGDAGRAARTGGALGDTSHAAHAAGGAADAAGSASHAAHGASGGGGIASGASSAGHAASGGGGIANSASHAANGAGSASHGVSSAADAAGSASHAAHAGGNTADAAGSASHATHAGGNTADAAGNTSHASHGGADVKDSALPPTDPGHRSNGVSSAAQPAATPHASAAGDASTGGHAAPANTAPSTPNGAHNNAFMNADTGGTTHGAGGTANGATSAPASGAPATGAGTHGAPATGAPATGAPVTGSHGAGASSAPATGTHGAGSAADGATGVPNTPATPQKKRSFEEILGGGDKQHTANGTPDSPTTPKKDTPAGDALGGDKQPHGGKHAADTPATHADETADARKAGHGSGDANGSGKADADAKQGHDSGEHADADPKAKDHSANGKADDAADSARHGDKTEADKPTSDKSHKEDDAAHHDGDEHPKDTDDKHTTKTDDADTKSTKDEANTHKSDKDDADGTGKRNDSTEGQGSGGGDGNGSGDGKRPLTKEEIEALPQAPRRGASAEAVDAWMDACIEQVPDLTRQELKAVYDYSGPQYEVINGWLRDPSMAVSADIPKTVETLNKFLDRLPPHEGTVFRGTKVPQHIIDEALRTGVYRDPAFFSTSTKPNVAEMFMGRLKPEPGEARVLFEIENASGSNIHPMSMYAKQDEILFKSGVEFDIVDAKHADGSYTIKLRQRE